MKKQGRIHGKKPNEYALGKCQRSGDIIEPLLKPQWYVDCKDLAKRSIEAVEKGELKIIPEEHINTWNHWLKNI